MSECFCWRCTQEQIEREPWDGEGLCDPRLMRFSFAACGNKRCPCAADHRNTCTNSNEPGQKGSLYE